MSDHLPVIGNSGVISYAVMVGFCVWLGIAATDKLFAPLSTGLRMITDILLKVMSILFFCLLVATVIAIIVNVYHAIVGTAA